ncbi:thiamine pyrophosphate-dependent enzyme [Subtercola endophyticus]|nr:thiamine pyrophosphate-dependent enzyme [Subtercola endophyticus]
MGAEPQLHALLSAGPLPHATLLWGRRVVDESGPGYLGTYAGAASDEVVRAGIEGADVLILAGVQFTDLTSGFFSQNFAAEKVIRLDPHRASVAGVEFGEIDLGDALAALTGILSANPPALSPNAAEASSPVRAEHAATGIFSDDGGGGSELLAQNSLWDVVCDALEPGDLVLADQGTSFYGMGAHRLAHDVVFVGQPLWAAIGFSLPALLGAALAAPERRPVLLIGDGAAQLTIAELGTMTRQGLAPIIVVVNNDGYTVERAIHGPNAAFNDIAAWDWTALPQAFARHAPGIRTARVETVDALRRALVDARANLAGLSLIEAVVPRLDVPPLLRSIAAAAARANAAPPA